MAFLLSSGNSGAQVTLSVRHVKDAAPISLHTGQVVRALAATLASRAKLTPQMGRVASQADRLLSDEVARQEFSGAVLLTRGGQVILSKGYGMADWDQQIANTPQTRFYLGSISKQFTAMAILILQERGKLRVQDGICAHIVPCPSTWGQVTLHELLTHTSGIPELDDASMSRASPRDWIESFDRVPLASTPGSQFSYCSMCYQILGYVVEQVSGEAYSEFLQEAIFGPLQMKDSGTEDARYTSVRNHAMGYAGWQYVDGGSGMDVDPQWSFLFGSGLVYSSTEDMYRWDVAISRHTLVSQQALDEAFTPYFASQYDGSGYGYGWFIARGPVARHTLIWHDGKIPGFRTYNGLYPDDGVEIIILSNLAPVDEMILAGQLEKILFAHA